MASLAVMAGGALVNTLAFSVTNFIFGQLEDHGTREIKRHNLAVERLSKAKEEYTKEHQQRLGYLDKTIREQRRSEQTFGDLVAMQEYYKITGKQLSPLRDPPNLADFYNPSRQRKDAEIALVVGGIVGLVTYKFFKSQETTHKNQRLFLNPCI